MFAIILENCIWLPISMSYILLSITLVHMYKSKFQRSPGYDSWASRQEIQPNDVLKKGTFTTGLSS